MDGPRTTIIDHTGKNEPKVFTFDHSYYSHSGFKELDDKSLEKLDPKYASQEDVFNDLGRGVLNNAYEGYGQTGAGKSYSMVGYGPNKGIVPMAFEELFSKIDKDENPNIQYRVTFSMLEIYMEQVEDLLADPKLRKKGGLKVRQNPKLGRFYVDGLSKVPVTSYTQISNMMDQGTANRTVAATQMNATSSRAHTVVTLQFDQIITGDDGQKTTKQSEVNLVDLAGSERAGSTGATGDRLKEGAQINKSLSALGNVISALATNKKAPFRDSVLTKLLQNSLGGNSKTIMIAALSPASINYDETLSTLRYADRAKQIKTKAAVNESATDKLIRQLREENERMKKMLEGGSMNFGETEGMTEEQIAKREAKMRAALALQMQQTEEQMARLDGSAYEEQARAWRLKNAEAAEAENERAMKLATTPHIVNLNEDPALSGVMVHFLGNGSKSIGRKSKNAESEQPDIALSGLSMKERHAIITLDDDGTTTLTQDDPEVADAMLVNGIPTCGTVTLNHRDRLLFGTNHLYIFKNPTAESSASEDTSEEIDWDFAQQEIIANKPRIFNNQLPDSAQEEVNRLEPMVTFANGVCKEMHKNREFSIILMDPVYAGLDEGPLKIMVKMVNLDTTNTWILTGDDFEGRRYRMEELWVKQGGGDSDNGDESDDDDDDDEEEDYIFEAKDGGEVATRARPRTARKPSACSEDTSDPFEHEAGDVVVGTVDVNLNCLAYNIGNDDDMFIKDYEARSQGAIEVGVQPCDASGTALSAVDDMIEDSDELKGKPLYFELSIVGGFVKNQKVTSGVKICYSHELLGGMKTWADARPADDGGANSFLWNHRQLLSVPMVDAAFIDWLMDGQLRLIVYAYQSDDVTELKTQRRSMAGLVLTLQKVCSEYHSKTRDASATITAIEKVLSGDESGAAVDEGFRGICGICGMPVTGQQERRKDDLGVYFHAWCIEADTQCKPVPHEGDGDQKDTKNLQKQVKKLEKQLENERAKEASSQKDIGSLKSKVAGLEKEVSAKQKKLSSLEKELAAAQKRAGDKPQKSSACSLM